MRNFKVADLRGGCRNCTYGKKCKGGCLAASVGITGEVFSDPYCFHLIEKNFNEMEYTLQNATVS
jgi:MoaA/NifB/PqqE/SkfB family radical SAM enzyme